MWPVITGAFLTGLVGGLHCIGMCGGFAASCSARQGGPGTAAYTGGRLLTYTALGAIGGAVGAGLRQLSLVGLILSAALLLYFAARLAGLVPERAVRIPGLTALIRRVGRRGSLGGLVLFGATTALIPCGLVYAALALPVVAGSASAGALAMLAFGLGTVPAMVGVGALARRIATLSVAARRGLAVAVVVAGSWAIVHRAPAILGEEPSCHTTGVHAHTSAEQGHTGAPGMGDGEMPCEHHQQAAPAQSSGADHDHTMHP